MQNLGSLTRKKFSFPVYLTTGNYEHIKKETQNYSPEWSWVYTTKPVLARSAEQSGIISIILSSPTVYLYSPERTVCFIAMVVLSIADLIQV